ncbi:hypothetical protein BKA59DRAFT_467689 [Fusarium tricinctum]|uniref:Uncharacterized protein n=1 Tax=Fusarium tricinctum TaxID=61284 RepID=A0A8K0S3E3_9HYPO|nr:hypothetical protein BKA59DRAFT_467689 [Fusarium tricinctum]
MPHLSARMVFSVFISPSCYPHWCCNKSAAGEKGFRKDTALTLLYMCDPITLPTQSRTRGRLYVMSTLGPPTPADAFSAQSHNPWLYRLAGTFRFALQNTTHEPCFFTRRTHCYSYYCWEVRLWSLDPYYCLNYAGPG